MLTGDAILHLRLPGMPGSNALGSEGASSAG